MKSEIRFWTASSMGRKGGLAKGPAKRRTPEHYRKMVEARKARKEGKLK